MFTVCILILIVYKCYTIIPIVKVLIHCIWLSPYYVYFILRRLYTLNFIAIILCDIVMCDFVLRLMFPILRHATTFYYGWITLEMTNYSWSGNNQNNRNNRLIMQILSQINEDCVFDNFFTSHNALPPNSKTLLFWSFR